MNNDQWFLDASQPQRIMDLNQYLGIMNANTLFIRILAFCWPSMHCCTISVDYGFYEVRCLTVVIKMSLIVVYVKISVTIFMSKSYWSAANVPSPWDEGLYLVVVLLVKQQWTMITDTLSLLLNLLLSDHLRENQLLRSKVSCRYVAHVPSPSWF